MEKVAFPTKSDIIYSTLKDQILYGERHSGERLIVADIAKKYSASPMPVREALQRLQLDGLVEIIPYVGARVSVMDAKQFEDIIVVRNMLEPVAARLAAVNMNDSDISKLFEYMQQMEGCAKENKIKEYTSLNHMFHALIWQSCGNECLLDILNNLYAKTEGTKIIFSRYPERMKDSCTEHRKIAEAIKDRDPDLAYKAYYDHKVQGFRKNFEIIESDYDKGSSVDAIDVELPII